MHMAHTPISSNNPIHPTYMQTGHWQFILQLFLNSSAEQSSSICSDIVILGSEPMLLWYTTWFTSWDILQWFSPVYTLQIQVNNKEVYCHLFCISLRIWSQFQVTSQLKLDPSPELTTLLKLLVIILYPFWTHQINHFTDLPKVL